MYIKDEYSRNHCVDYLNERFVGLLEEVIIQIESGNVCERELTGGEQRLTVESSLECITTKVVHTIFCQYI